MLGFPSTRCFWKITMTFIELFNPENLNFSITVFPICLSCKFLPWWLLRESYKLWRGSASQPWLPCRSDHRNRQCLQLCSGWLWSCMATRGSSSPSYQYFVIRYKIIMKIRISRTVSKLFHLGWMEQQKEKRRKKEIGKKKRKLN